MKLLIFSILIYIFISIITVFITENITDREIKHPPLYDMIHENTPVYPNPYVPDYLVLFFIFYTIIRWGLIDFKKVTLFFLSLSVILFMRLFTFTLTQTAPPRKLDSKWRIDHCKRNLMKHFGISFNKISSTCVDNMYSGHASHIVVAVTIILLYSKSIYEKIGLSLLALISIITIITGRLHYTSDVIIATYISSLMVFFMSMKIKYFS